MAQGGQMAAGFLTGFENEMGKTRRMLERVPEARFGWRPHEKSMTMGALADHIAGLVSWAKMVVDTDALDLAAVPQDELRPREPESGAALLATFDANAASARQALSGASDERLAQPWSLRHGARTIMTAPRIGVLQGTILDHVIHHRGQMSVYLRLNDVPVPGMYGPSADEGGA